MNVREAAPGPSSLKRENHEKNRHPQSTAAAPRNTSRTPFRISKQFDKYR